MSGDPFSPLPIRRIEVDPAGERPDRRSWPATIPAVAQLLHEGLDLGAATVLVGENGTGKSTLVEAIAMSYGLGAEGGSTGARNRTYDGESGLDQHLRCIRNAGTTRWGFLLRAETMHSFYSYLHDNPNDRSPDPEFHHLSHGESFRALFDSSRFRGPGFYVFDEPESALSFSAQLALLGQLMELLADGRSQVVVSTHSPVLASLPGARLLELGEWGVARTVVGRARTRRPLPSVPRRPRALSKVLDLTGQTLRPSGPKVVAVNGSLTSKRMPRTPVIPKPARRSVCIAR